MKLHITKILFFFAAILLGVACTGPAEPEGSAANDPQKTEEDMTETITLYVAPTLVDCVGEAPQQCMQISTDPDGVWEWFYDQIEGFDYEEGFEYQLTVNKVDIENPPADASSIRYELVEVVSKSEAVSDEVAVNITVSVYDLIDYLDLPADTILTIQVADVSLADAPANVIVEGVYQDVTTLPFDTMLAFGSASDYQNRMLTVSARVESADGRLLFTSDAHNPVDAQQAINNVTVWMQPIDSTPVGGDALAGTSWDLVSLLGESVVGERIPHIAFEKGEVHGSDGCNGFGGRYSADSTTLKIDTEGFASTLIACEEAIMTQADNFLNAFRTAHSYTISEGTLTIHTENGDLVFNAPNNASLENTRWVLSGIATEDGVMVLTALDADMWIEFDGGGFAGKSTCNNVSGSYTLDGNIITLGTIGMTRMACPDGERGERETAFVTALGMIAGYSIERDTLTFTDANGDHLLSFVAEGMATE